MTAARIAGRPAPGDCFRTRAGRILTVGAVWCGGVVFEGSEDLLATHAELAADFTPITDNNGDT